MTELFAANPLVQAIGSALVAFLWQGAAIGVVTFVLAACVRRATPQTKYVVGCLALAALMATPVITVIRYRQIPAGLAGYTTTSSVGVVARGDALPGISTLAVLPADVYS